jgi:hypothetical protein
MPYADPEVRKQKDKERKSRPEVMERNRELYRKRYAENKNGLADKVKTVHHSRWADPAYREQRKQQYYKRWEKDWVGQKLVQLKAAARKKGLDFSLTREDLVFPERCPVFGMVLVKHRDSQGNNSASVDRIDNSKGYVAGNVVVVSLKANAMKREASLDELRRLVAFYEGLERTNNE